MIGSGRIIFTLTLFAMLVQSLVFFYDEAAELLAVPLILIFAGIGVFFLGKDRSLEHAEFQVNIFLWAFSVRLWMGMILYGWDLKDLFGDEDASGYVFAWRMAENWWTNGFEGFSADIVQVFFERQNIGQSLVWAVPTFFAGDESRMIVSVVNCFAGAMLAVVIFKMAGRVFGFEVASIAAVLVIFWPSNILLSASTAKEMLVITLEWAILYLLIRDPRGLTVKDSLLAVPLLLLVFISRFYALYMLAAAVVFRFLARRGDHLVRNVAFGSVMVVSLFIFLNAGGALTRDFERIERLSTAVEDWRVGVAHTTGSGIEVYTEYESAGVAIPVATVYFFFAPFPWEIFSGTARNAFGAIENIFIIGILIIGFPAMKIVFKDRFVEMAPVFVFCALYAGMHIWGLSNIGLAWRHKQTIMPLLFILVAVGITQRRAGLDLLSGRLRKGRTDHKFIHVK